MSGSKNAFNTIGKNPPTINFSTVFLISLPTKKVNALATSVISAPKIISSSAQPVIRLTIIQPIKRPGIASIKNNGRIVKASQKRS